jgi:hypothetical protein
MEQWAGRLLLEKTAGDSTMLVDDSSDVCWGVVDEK